MSAAEVFESVADVLDKVGSYIDALESHVESASSEAVQHKQAQEQAELEELVTAITDVSAVDAAELRQKLSAAPADVRDVIRSLVGQSTDTDVGNITEKRGAGNVSYKDDPDEAFLNWINS